MESATVIQSQGSSATVKPGRPVLRMAATGLAIAVTLAFASASGAAEQNSAVKEGQKAYMAHCASCHGTTGVGDGPVADTLKNKPANLTLLAQQEKDGTFPTQRVMDIVQGNKDYDKNFRTHGPAEMPVWGNVFYDESGQRSSIAKTRIRNLVDYIKSIQK